MPIDAANLLPNAAPRPAAADPAFARTAVLVPAATPVFVGRLGSVRNASQHFAFWLVLRGTGEVETREGRFALRRGDWITLEVDSGLELQLGQDAVAIGLQFPLGRARAHGTTEHGLIPASGRMARRDLRDVCALWRRYAREPMETRLLKPLLLQLRHEQRDLDVLLQRCPGRTTRRKRQVLVRMQRVRLMLQGNPHRIVSLDELARLTQFSDWWVSKTFKAVYGDTIQKTSIQLRMLRARTLLAETALSITEICEACGFHDPCSFARLFKSCHGQTASQWRADHQAIRQQPPVESPPMSPALRRTGT